MSGLKIAATVFRAEAVRNLSQPPQGVRVSRGSPVRVCVQSREFAYGVTQLPAEFRGSRFLRPGERVEEEVIVISAISLLCHHDLCGHDGPVKVDDACMSAVRLVDETRHLLQGESRVPPSEEDSLQFDLNPRQILPVFGSKQDLLSPNEQGLSIIKVPLHDA